MNTDPNREDPLDRLLSELPRSVEPSRDLWSGIESRMDHRPPYLSWPTAIAAGVALVAVTALVTMLLVDARRVPAPSTNTIGSTGGQMTAGTLADAKLAATRDELRRAFDARLPLLAPATRAAVLHRLTTMHDAHRELERALAADPSSSLVRDLLYATAEQEYSLYQDVVHSTDSLAVRT